MFFNLEGIDIDLIEDEVQEVLVRSIIQQVMKLTPETIDITLP